MTSHVHPDAVDRVDDHRHDAESHDIPCDLRADGALAAEHKAALDREIDGFADDHGDHVGNEVAQAAHHRAAFLDRVAEDVPGEGLTEDLRLDAGPAEVKEGQDQILDDGNEVADDHKQAALTDPPGCAGVLVSEVSPPVNNSIHIFASITLLW